MISFTVNGQPAQVDVEAEKPLLWVLREDLNITGPKYGCGVASCGACTVLVDGLPASSCSTLAADMEGRSVVTIEGLGTAKSLDPVQQAFVDHGAMQCGFCTPGMVLAVKALLSENPSPTEDEVRHYLRGNVCRCTGYVKIIEAVLDLASREATQRPA